MTLWDYALAVWERPGVSQACLELQDRDGQCVPLLLWAAWALSEGRHADIDGAIDLARPWDGQVIGPLRAARRALADLAPDGVVFTATQATELSAEWALIDALEAVKSSASVDHGEPITVLVALMEAWNGPGPRTRAERLWEVLR